MRKQIKLALSAVCAGALIAGIGVGVAFAEYSALRFEDMPPQDADGAPVSLAETTVASADLSVPEDVGIAISGPFDVQRSLVADDSVPVGTVRIAAHASAFVDEIVIDGPYIPIEENYEGQFDDVDEQQDAGQTAYISIHPVLTDRGPFAYKDQILEGLKRGVVYQVPDLTEGFDVEVRLNPADLERVA
ncbi:MAG: hypothetical protein SOU51_03995 [Collinsella sp.]|nr:hypothetical protein [Collinsella sp.]